MPASLIIRDVTLIDGRGLWAVPGLIETHVHLELLAKAREDGEG